MDNDVVYMVSVFCGPYDGWSTEIVTASKRTAWLKYRELILGGFWEGIRILEWRDGLVRDVIVEYTAWDSRY